MTQTRKIAMPATAPEPSAASKAAPEPIAASKAASASNTASKATSASSTAILEVHNLTKKFTRPGAFFKQGETFEAVSDVSFDMYEGEILCLLGESGCGKTTLARMLMHLTRPTSGKIFIDGTEVQALNERRFRQLRCGIQMVYQNPFDCLDPSRRVGGLLQEPLKLWHAQLSPAERAQRIEEVLAECGLDTSCLKKRPSEFSGGQLQRLSIARALLVRPRLLIADEIVSALDVPIQNQILQLLTTMKDEHRFTVLFITHDLAVARKVSDRVMIMRQGALAGIGPTADVLDGSEDPYIRKLAASGFTFNGSAD